MRPTPRHTPRLALRPRTRPGTRPAPRRGPRRALFQAALLAALTAGLAAAPAALAQSPPEVGRGERVDVTGAEFPPLVVAGRVFHPNATVVNRDSVSHTVLLTTTLYRGSSATPCEGSRSLGNVSMFANSVSLAPGEEARVVGAEEHWGHVVNGSRVQADGPAELCVWMRLASCPEFTPACFLDFHPVQVQVRMRNSPPTAAIEVEPGTRGTSDTQFSLRARGEDADGDPIAFRWAFGDGRVVEGPATRQRFGAGTHVVTLHATDGWDGVQAAVTLEVGPAQGGGPGSRPAPGPGLPALALALVLGALTAGGRASRGAR